MAGKVTAKLFNLSDIVTSGSGASPVATITGGRQAGWQELKSQTGTGHITIPNADSQRALVSSDQVICFYLDTVPAFSFVVNDDLSTVIAPSEELDEETVFSGPGLLGLLSEAIVYPSRGADTQPIQEDRLFSWPAPEYDDSGWSTATVLCTLAYAQANWPVTPFAESMPTTGTPPEVVAPGGSTILLATTGDWYFRKTVNFASDGLYTFYLCVDNTGDLYVDGCPVISLTQGDSYLKTQAFNVFLTAGDHTIAGKVTNLPGGVNNPTAAVLDIYLGEADQPTSTWITSLDATWKTLEYPGTAPGMTPGKVIHTILAEAQARGALTGWSTDFSVTSDSHGSAWTFNGDIATRVGNDYRTFICDEMAATYIDVKCDPLALKLHAYNLGSMGSSTSVSLHAPTAASNELTGNLTELSHDRRAITANSLLSRWSGGWHGYTVSPGVGERRKEATFALGAVRSTGEVERIAAQQLSDLADVRSAVTIGWEPVGSGDMPYESCHVGDLIIVPDRDGTPVSEEIISFTVDVDDNNELAFKAEIKDVVLSAQERFENSLKKMTDGTLRGSVTVTTPPAPSTITFKPPAVLPIGAVISASMIGTYAAAGTALADYTLDNYDEIDYTTGFLDYFSYNLFGGTLIAQKNVWFFVNGYVQWSVADYTDQMELQVYSSTIPGPRFRERGIATTGWDTNDYFQQTSGIMYLASGDSVSLHIRTVNGNNGVGHRQLDVIVLDQTNAEFSGG